MWSHARMGSGPHRYPSASLGVPARLYPSPLSPGAVSTRDAGGSAARLHTLRGGMPRAMLGARQMRVPNAHLAGSPGSWQSGQALMRGAWWCPTMGDRVAPAMQSHAASTSPSAADPQTGLIGSSLCTSCVYFRAVAAAGCPPSPACPLPGLPPGFNVLPARCCGAA